jgi:hypothetical protein
MSEGLRISLGGFDSQETRALLGGVIKDALSAQGKGMWVGTSAAWIGTKATEAIGDAIGGIDLLDLFGEAWAQASALQECADPEKYPPDKTSYVKLGEHTVKFDVKPTVVASVGPWSSPPIEVVMELSALISAVELRVKAGRIQAACGGECDLGLTLSVGEKELMPRKSLKTFQLDVEHQFKAPGLSLGAQKPRATAGTHVSA